MKPSLSLYIYTIFVFILVCVVLFIAKKLFSGAKIQSKLLDEKETKLLQLYATIEEVMEEFYDAVNDSKEDIDSALRRLNNESGRRATSPPPVVYSQTKESEAKSKPKAKAQKPVIDYVVDGEPEEPDQQTFLEAMLSADEEIKESPTPDNPKNDKILSMHKKGKSNAEIAKELGITQTEISMVIGLNGMN